MPEINHAKAFKEILFLAFYGCLLLKFLNGVSMPEAFVLCTIVVMILVYSGLLSYLALKKEKINSEREALINEPLERLAKDVAELKHKVNADTLQKGFRLK